MRMIGRRLRGWGPVIGVGATALVMALYAGGALIDFENWAYDLRMRHFNTVPESDRIVHIDLTDDSFDLIDSWPWPRRLHADLIDALTELGAAQIGFDIEFKRAKAARVGPFNEPIDDDAEMSAALQRSGRCFIPLSFPILPPGQDIETLRRRAREVLAREPGISEERFVAALGVGDLLGQMAKLRFQLGELLAEDFSLTRGEAAAQLGVAESQVDAVLAGVKLSAAQERAWALLEREPGATREELVREVLGDEEAHDPLDVEDLARAHEWARSLRAVLAYGSTKIEAAAGTIPEMRQARPPIEVLTAGLAGSGFVSFEADRGVVRKIPLLVRQGPYVVKQLGFAMACGLLGIADEEIQVTAEGEIELPDPRERGRRLRIRLDEKGQALINWSPGRGRAQVDEDGAAKDDTERPGGRGEFDDQWTSSFTHLPVTRVMEIPILRRRIAQNERAVRLAHARLIELFSTEGAAAEHFGDAARLERLMLLGERASEAERAELEAVRARMAERERAAVEMLRAEWGNIEGAEAETEEERAELEEYRQLYHDVVEGKLRERIEPLRAQFEGQIEERRAALRPMIEGKVCLVGYTASAIADMKPSPVFKMTPGVMVHSNIINQMLAGRMPRSAGRGFDLLAIAACGLLVGLAAALTPAVSGVLIMLGVNAAYVALNALVLYRVGDVCAALVGPVLAAAAAWGGVTVYRQLTEEREKRRFSRALATYVSPAVARQLAERADRLDLSPADCDVTCFFSDLKGFTTLSEQLGARQTQMILNPYLGAMSDVLQRHQALINKFMGDGIFAFYNAPIYPCKDHAAQACAGALECFVALEELKKHPPHEELAGPMAALSMRVGISTGNVFVGDYGSEAKRDYTTIGDAINLGARLEPANKAFGTRIAVAEPTVVRAGSGFVFRELGRIRVVGKAEGVSVYELLGRAGEVNGALREHAERFGEALETFRRREWARAREAFAACAALRPDDLCAGLYLEQIAGYVEAAPGDDWQATIELTTK